MFEKEQNPETLAIHNVEQFIRKDQRENIKLLKPFMDVLQQGPWSAQEALEMEVVDGIGYHHDLLEELQREGIKTWSLRKYTDAVIIQASLGRYDMSRLVIPQFFGRKHKKDSEGKDHTERKNLGLHLNLAIINSQNPPTLDGMSLKLDCFIPRNVGLIYLDSAIEGYALRSMELTTQ